MSEHVFTNATIAGPVSVYVKDGRIVRIRPLQVDENDLKPWAIADARGARYSPPKQALSHRQWPWALRLHAHPGT